MERIKDKSEKVEKKDISIFIYIFWVIVDIVAIQLLNRHSHDLMNRYMVLRISAMSFAMGFRALKYCYILFKGLDVFRREYIDIYDEYEDIDDDYPEERFEVLKRMFKQFVSIVEVSGLCILQMLVIIYYRRDLSGLTAFELMVGIILMGSLVCAIKTYINKKYDI